MPMHDAKWVLVVEDEPRLRAELVGLLTQLAPDFGAICDVSNAHEAQQLLCTRNAPDVAFIDIHLPGDSGLTLAQRLPETTRVVFVTAFDAHAIQAFEQGAIDYVLKPVTHERLARTVERLRTRASAQLSTQTGTQINQPALDMRSVLAALNAQRPQAYARWLTASVGKRTRLIPVDEIGYLQSDNKYTRIVAADGEYLIEESLKTLLERLDPAIFVQVHRATVVNVGEVLMVERDDNGGGTLHLRTPKEPVRISAQYMRAFKMFVAQ